MVGTADLAVMAMAVLMMALTVSAVLYLVNKNSKRKKSKKRPAPRPPPPAPAPAPAPGPAPPPPAPPALPGGTGKVVDERARVTYYRPADNDPPNSRNCAYTPKCTSPNQGSPSSAAHGRGSPYAKGGLYTISGAGRPPFCVRIDDTCAACKGTWIDVFLEDGQRLPFDYAKVTEGC